MEKGLARRVEPINILTKKYTNPRNQTIEGCILGLQELMKHEPKGIIVTLKEGVCVYSTVEGGGFELDIRLARKMRRYGWEPLDTEFVGEKCYLFRTYTD